MVILAVLVVDCVFCLVVLNKGVTLKWEEGRFMRGRGIATSMIRDTLRLRSPAGQAAAAALHVPISSPFRK